KNINKVLAVLICFEAVTGLRVNIHKSVLYTVGDVHNGSELADILGCSRGFFPASYLGLPLGTRGANKEIWGPVLANTRSRLDGWKVRFLSFGGRITLLKSVLSNLPIYYLSLFKAPASVIKQLERMQNKFLWEGVSQERKHHLVGWNKVKIPLNHEGLGILDLRCVNEALLGKWVWRFATERNAWWRRLIECKNEGGPSNWRPSWNLQNAGWPVWRNIVMNCPKFWEHTLLDPGGGGCPFGLIIGFGVGF
ncbi:Putative ribonuclease H protein At1g65750, partial [Linum perenne]